MNPSPCPRCHAEAVVTGQLVPGADSPRPISFYPDGTRPRSFEGHWWGVELPARHQACLACGHVWATIDPEALGAFLASNRETPAAGSAHRSGGAIGKPPVDDLAEPLF